MILRPNIIRGVPDERTVLLVYLCYWLWPFDDGMHALVHGFEWNVSLRRFCLGVMMAFGLRAYLLGQYVRYPKPSGLYRIADAVGFGAVLSLVPVAVSAEVEGSTRVLYFAMFVGIGLLITPTGSKNATKYEWWHGFNPDNIADQVVAQDRWYIIVLLICAVPFHSERLECG